MAKNSINYNLLIAGAVVIGGLYFWQKIKSSPSGNAAVNYTSALSGENISSATQPTIRTDIRQSARTIRAENRQDTRLTLQSNRLNEKAERALNRQASRQKVWEIITPW